VRKYKVKQDLPICQICG